jgi:Fe(3+) dicitrate transport protein
MANDRRLLSITRSAVLAPLALSIGHAAAQEEPLLIERIVVTASVQRATDVAGSVEFLDAEELEINAYGDINRILRVVPGVNLVEEDGFGLRPNIGIRGSGTDRNSKIAVMEDGVLIAPAPYAAPAAYYFPRSPRITGVEVSKGPAAIKYGPQTVAGAINLLSAPIPFEERGDVNGGVSLLGGNHGTWRGHALAGGIFETGGPVAIGFSLEILQEHSDGFKDLDSGGDTGYRIEDYVAKLLFRSASDAAIEQSLELKFQYSDETSDETYLGLTWADFLADPYRRYRGSQVDQMNVEHHGFQATHGIALGDRIDLTTVAYYHDTARAWYKLNDVLSGGSLRSISSVLADPVTFAQGYQTLVGAPGFTSAANALRVRNNNREYYAAGVQSVLGVGFDLGPSMHEVELSFRYHQDEEDRFQEDDRYQMQDGTMVLTQSGAPGSQDNRVGEADAWAFYLRDTIDWGPLTLVPGIRHEIIDLTRTNYAGTDPARVAPTSVNESDESVWIPGVGAAYRLSDEWKLIAGIHRGFASPAPGSAADAETSWNYEAGARFNDGVAQLEVIGFYNDFSNLVGTCTNSTGGGCNVGDQFDGGGAHIWGLEVSAAYDAGRHFGGMFSVPLVAVYTFTDSKFLTSFNSSFGEWGTVARNDELPGIPEHQLTLRAGLEAERWRGSLTMSYVSKARAVAGTGPIPIGENIDARTIFDASFEYDVLDNASLFASVQNFTDEVYNVAWTPAGARPGLPRSVLGGIRFEF